MPLTGSETTLLAAIIAGSAALFGTSITMHYHTDEAQRNERTRWYGDRKKAYATFMSSVPRLFTLSLGEAERIHLGKPKIPDDHIIEHLDMMNEAVDAIEKISGEIEMVGSLQACKAMKKIMSLIEEVRNLYPTFSQKNFEKLSRKEWTEKERSLQERFDRALQAFRNIARKDLGLGQ